MFDWARQFAAADQIVIAAPYWDLSFPAALIQATGLDIGGADAEEILSEASNRI